MSKFTKFPIEADSSGIIYGTSYLDSVRQQVRFIILTNPGERVNRPKYGVGIKKYIFENILNINNTELKYDLYQKIKRQFDLYLTNVTISSLDVKQEENTVFVKINFLVNEVIEDNLIIEI